eukprot:3931914-Rhodomonas_salina.1
MCIRDRGKKRKGGKSAPQTTDGAFPASSKFLDGGSSSSSSTNTLKRKMGDCCDSFLRAKIRSSKRAIIADMESLQRQYAEARKELTDPTMDAEDRTFYESRKRELRRLIIECTE